MNLKLASQLQLLRKEKGLTQEELASIFNVTNQSISKWETGQSCPDIATLPDIADFFGVSVDDLLGYRPSSTINSIYLQMNTLISSIADDGEKMDTVYRLARLANACTRKNETDTIAPLIAGKSTNSQSYFQAYGDKFGGLSSQGSESIFISSFKEYPLHGIPELRRIYKEISSLSNINVLKVLQAMFYNQNKRFHIGMTIDELKNETKLSENEILDIFNKLDLKLNKNNDEERWFLTHLDVYPLLVMLSMSSNLFN